MINTLELARQQELCKLERLQHLASLRREDNSLQLGQDLGHPQSKSTRQSTEEPESDGDGATRMSTPHGDCGPGQRFAEDRDEFEPESEDDQDHITANRDSYPNVPTDPFREPEDDELEAEDPMRHEQAPAQEPSIFMSELSDSEQEGTDEPPRLNSSDWDCECLIVTAHIC